MGRCRIFSGVGYQLFRFGNMGYVGPVMIDNIYGEYTVRIGNFTGNTAFLNSGIFHGGMVNLNEFLMDKCRLPI